MHPLETQNIVNDKKEKISGSDIKSALERSGYLLESRIESLLDEYSYLVQANASYPDPNTGKSRELDLSALLARQLGKGDDYLFVNLLIECVNNPQPIAFFTKEPQASFVYYEDFRVSGLPVTIIESDAADAPVPINDFLNMGDYHHYGAERVATQFCSFHLKKNPKEWMAFHEESQFDAFRKLCDALEHEVSAHHYWVLDERRENINLFIHYPVLVVQGELLDVRPSKRSFTTRKANHIQFRRSSYAGENEIDTQIDVVTERYFAKYLDIIGEEREKIARRIVRRRTAFDRSVKEFVSRANNEGD